ncbi:hypothetical protein [Candidatus Terasakiella magnetica]
MSKEEMETGCDHDGQEPSQTQRKWLVRGLEQAGGKLPLFDEYGQQVNPQTVRSCIRNGWAEPWFTNPLKPDWLVCRITELGREVLGE